MYFNNASPYGDIAMIILYFCLFIFWLFIFAEVLVSRNATSSILRYTRFRAISLSFLSLSFLLFAESLYWTLATASRVGILPASINGFFYYSWHVFAVKSLILIVGIVFLILFRRTHNHLEDRFSSLYFTQFLDSSVDAVGVLDKNGKILFWNKGSENLYGFSREEVLYAFQGEFLPFRWLSTLAVEIWGFVGSFFLVGIGFFCPRGCLAYLRSCAFPASNSNHAPSTGTVASLMGCQSSWSMMVSRLSAMFAISLAM